MRSADLFPHPWRPETRAGLLINGGLESEVGGLIYGINPRILRYSRALWGLNPRNLRYSRALLGLSPRNLRYSRALLGRRRAGKCSIPCGFPNKAGSGKRGKMQHTVLENAPEGFQIARFAKVPSRPPELGIIYLPLGGRKVLPSARR